MVYVTWEDNNDDELNVETFLTWEDAEEFVKENGLNMEENACEMDW